MTDLISRADAIEAVCNAQCELDVPHYPQCDQVKYCDEIKALLALPSADRPQGEWKHTITGQPYCSNCEYVFDEDEEYSPFWKFCPMCGAEMADNSLVNYITESSNDVVESKDDVITEDYMW